MDVGLVRGCMYVTNLLPSIPVLLCFAGTRWRARVCSDPQARTRTYPVWEQHQLLLTRSLYANPAASSYDQVRERADAGALCGYVRGVHDDVKGVMRLAKVRARLVRWLSVYQRTCLCMCMQGESWHASKVTRAVSLLAWLTRLRHGSSW
jgi:hypothetical protein